MKFFFVDKFVQWANLCSGCTVLFVLKTNLYLTLITILCLSYIVILEVYF